MAISKFSTWTFVALLLISAILVAHLLSGFLAPAVLALAIVSILGHVHKKFLAFFKNRAYMAASFSTLLALLCLLIPLSLFFLALIQQAIAIYQAIQQVSSQGHLNLWLSSLETWLQKLQLYLLGIGIKIDPQKIINVGLNLAQDLGQRIYNSIGLIAANLMSLGFDFILTVAFVFVFFVSGRSAKSFIMDLIPIPQEEKEALVRRFQTLSSAIFIGNGLFSILEGIIGGLLCLIFGIKGALVWGVAMAIAAFLPLVGASIIIIPITLYLFLNGLYWQASLFLVINTIQLSVIEIIIKPKFIGTKSQMHALLVFLSIIAGAQVYGIVGLFYGPLLVTIFLSLAEIYKDHYRKQLTKN